MKLNSNYYALKVSLLRIFSVAISFICSTLTARALGANDFGTYTSITAYLSVINTVFYIGLPNIFEREIATSRALPMSIRHERLKRLATYFFVILCLYCSLCCIVTIFFDEKIIIFSISVLISFISALTSSALRGCERVELASIADGLFRPILSLLALGISIYIVHISYIIGFICQIIGMAGSIAFSLLILSGFDQSFFKKIILSSVKTRSIDNFYYTSRSYFISGCTFLLMQLMSTFKSQFDILILTTMSTPRDVAHFFAATRAASATGIFYSSLMAITGPKLARLRSAGNLDEICIVLRNSTRDSFIYTLLLSIFCAISAPLYFRLFGNGYEVAYSSLIIMLCSWIFLASAGPVAELLISDHKERWIWAAIGTGLIGGYGAAKIFIPKFGIVGAACASLTANIITTFILLLFVKRTFGFSIFAFLEISDRA